MASTAAASPSLGATLPAAPKRRLASTLGLSPPAKRFTAQPGANEQERQFAEVIEDHAQKIDRIWEAIKSAPALHESAFSDHQQKLKGT